MVLVRQEIGDVLRDFRLQKGQTLRQVASRASVALGYLSEVERGQKEASSEILGSLADALEVPISVIMREVSDRLALLEGLGVDVGRAGEPHLAAGGEHVDRVVVLHRQQHRVSLGVRLRLRDQAEAYRVGRLIDDARHQRAAFVDAGPDRGAGTAAACARRSGEPRGCRGRSRGRRR